MAVSIYALCALTSLTCAFLLLRRFGAVKSRILLWSGLCFVGLTLSNAMLVLDKVVFPLIDLSLWRRTPALVGMLLLLYGLIYDEER